MTPPFPPETSSDPVTAMAALIIESELVLTGRATEGIERFEKTPHPELGPISDLGRIFYASHLSSRDDRDERTTSGGEMYRCRPRPRCPCCIVAAIGLRAEISGDMTQLAPAAEEASSVSELLVLRAYAANGDTDAAAPSRARASGWPCRG